LAWALTLEEEGVLEKNPSRVDCLPVEEGGAAFLGAMVGSVKMDVGGVSANSRRAVARVAGQITLRGLFAGTKTCLKS
jgi:hypothetical protein